MASNCEFFLGVHEPSWLRLSPVPLFVSRRRLSRLKVLPVAVCDWECDSGGFSELSIFGEWRTTPRQYVGEVRRYIAEVGRLRGAFIQDYMCEAFIVRKTGLSVAEHQRRTVRSYLELRDLAPDVPWVPVVQGFEVGEYLGCVELYLSSGVDLGALPLVGVGSLCRRQAVGAGASVIRQLAEGGLRLHGLGFKTRGLAVVGHLLASADSMAWSVDARWSAALDGHRHKNCANCFEYALRWRLGLLQGL
jgi:hypothetical protein